MKHLLALLIALVALVVFFGGLMVGRVTAPQTNGEVSILPEGTMCTADAMLCPDGSYVGRTGPNCEFVCSDTAPALDTNPNGVEALRDRIVLASPLPGSTITSPLIITGEARGLWFFEASFPVTLTNWDGLIIAEGIATAESDWMTEDFVPFRAELTFTSPYEAGDPTFMERGSLILKRDNPSGLPENDAALEITVQFAPGAPTARE
jgi:Immunoglobulin-like domain of bacterial spore germination